MRVDDALRHRPFPCSSRGEGSPSNRGTYIFGYYDFMTARDGRRAEKVLVNGAREKVGEMGELSREVGEWSLLDEAGDMRGARRELDGHEAPARPIDNQVL